jgi:hypothetical protein
MNFVFAVALLLFAQNCFALLKQGDKDSILDAHNRWRQQTSHGQTRDMNGRAQPRAANMYKLTWDDELAAGAQQWSTRCREGHSMIPGIGENIALGDLTPLELAELWFNEIQTSTVPDYGRYDGKGGYNGHYTQVVWGSSTKIGCGATYCPTSVVGKGIMLVCRYKENGNYVGYPIYEEGEPCSACTRCDSHYQLCLADDQQDTGSNVYQSTQAPSTNRHGPWHWADHPVTANYQGPACERDDEFDKCDPGETCCSTGNDTWFCCPAGKRCEPSGRTRCI